MAVLVCGKNSCFVQTGMVRSFNPPPLAMLINAPAPMRTMRPAMAMRTMTKVSIMEAFTRGADVGEECYLSNKVNLLV